MARKKFWIIQDIPRVIPYSVNRKTNKLEFKGKDGLLEYSNELTYIEPEYDKILQNNYDFLLNIKQIRNKYEHKMDVVKYLSSVNGSDVLYFY